MNHLNICDRKIVISGTVLRIAKLDADKYHFIDNPAPILAALRHSCLRVDVFSFLQRLGQSFPVFTFPFYWDNLAVLPISSFDEWWNKQIRFEARNRARQAVKKGLSIREVAFSEELVRGICEIYNEVPIRQGRPFPHYDKAFDTVYHDTATYLDCSIFIGAYDGERLIGFAKLVTDERGHQANFMNILSLLAYRDRAPTNALIAEAVRSCAVRSINYLVYQNFVYGTKGPDTLSKFKEVNGFRRVDVPRYFVPLTPLGHLGVKCGCHRAVTDWLPPAVAGRLREWRSQWYLWRQHWDAKV